MKLSVKTTLGGGMFGGGPSSEVSIEGQDYEAAPATVTVLALLDSLGVGKAVDFPAGDDETTKADTADVPDVEPSRISEPGDVVRIWFPDHSSRFFIDNGRKWKSPAVQGHFTEPMTVEYDDPEGRVELIGRLGESLALRDGQE